MKKYFALATLLASLPLVEGYKPIKQINQENIKLSTTIYLLPENKSEIDRITMGTMDIDSDGNGSYDLKVIGYEGKELIYAKDKDNDGKYDIVFIDPKQDGLNMNEESCKSLEECLDRARDLKFLF